jgi:hypothetical protein
MRHSAVVSAVVSIVLTVPEAIGRAQTKETKVKKDCLQAVFEGDVKAGQSFEREFAPGLKFLLEPLNQGSGWIVRVLPVGQLRGAHDFAELATPPYRSVTPLAVSTDFAFRAQDAVGWNPRRFRYAKDAASARRLEGLYAGVIANDARANSELAELTMQQPEGELQILNAVMVPGTANQWQQAAAVALHFENTPHEVEQGTQPTSLGNLEELQFRVKLQLEPRVRAAQGVAEEKNPCAVSTTVVHNQPH